MTQVVGDAIPEADFVDDVGDVLGFFVAFVVPGDADFFFSLVCFILSSSDGFCYTTTPAPFFFSLASASTSSLQSRKVIRSQTIYLKYISNPSNW